MPSFAPTIVFIGGGPRSAGILERLAANRPGLFDGPLSIHVVEPYEPGSGRIWRYDQSPGLLLNSTAADVTMFTDSSVACDGPSVDGPGLAAWAAGVLDGSIRDVPQLEPHLLEQLRALTPASFPSRQLQSRYLEWFFRRAVAALGPDVTVTVHRDTATAVEHLASGPDGGAEYRVRLASDGVLEADLVVYSLGHTDSRADPESARLADFAARHGGFHAAPSYTTDVDYSAIAPGQDVLVSGMGLAFVDLSGALVRGPRRPLRRQARRRPGLCAVRRRTAALGRLPPRSARTTPRSRPPCAGNPSAPRGTSPPPPWNRCSPRTRSWISATQLWPLIAKDAGYAYYRELFTGYPERVHGGWDEFSARFDALDWYSREREDLVAAAVPDPTLRLDLEALDQPFSGCAFADHAAVQRSVANYIERDLKLRTSPDHSETLALFTALLRVYMELGRLVPQERLNSRSQQAVHGWWHGFFSFVDSGPPPHRLREILALHRAGLLQFLGPGMWVRPDEASGRFVAGSFQSPVVVDAAAYIEARLPSPSVARSANPALADLHDAGWGTEQSLLTSDGPHSTGKLLVSSSHEVLAPDGVTAGGAFRRRTLDLGLGRRCVRAARHQRSTVPRERRLGPPPPGRTRPPLTHAPATQLDSQLLSF